MTKQKVYEVKLEFIQKGVAHIQAHSFEKAQLIWKTYGYELIHWELEGNKTVRLSDYQNERPLKENQIDESIKFNEFN
jgi:hypothetical protein|tara:strand:+ start:223 stop:456 length:234 start_codon:yes stop_codon:yes gene_type:complete